MRTTKKSKLSRHFLQVSTVHRSRREISVKNRSLSAVTAGVNHSSLTAPQVSYQPELQRKISVTSIYPHNYSQSLLFSRRKKEVMLYTLSLHPFQSPKAHLSHFQPLWILLYCMSLQGLVFHVINVPLCCPSVVSPTAQNWASWYFKRNMLRMIHMLINPYSFSIFPLIFPFVFTPKQC